MENHEDIESQTKDADAQEQSKNVVSFFIFFFQSVVAGALLSTVLGSAGGDTVIAIWRLSLLLCSYFYSAVCVLSPTTRKDKACLFVSLTYADSMAFVVDAALSHGLGTAIIYIYSVWMAGVFGHALAEHTASSSFEKRAPSPVEAREKLAGELIAMAFLTIVFAACVLSPACIMDGGDVDPQVVVAILPVLLCPFLTMAIICTLKPWPSPGAPSIVAIHGVEYDTSSVFVYSVASPLIIFFVFLILLGEVGAAVVSWICVLGLAVLLGYCLRLHAFSACNTIDRWLSVRSRPKPELLSKKHAAAAGMREEQADAAGGNREQTVITVLDQVLEIE